MEPIKQFNQSTQKVIESLKEDLKTVRTGHANPSLVENIVADTYGGQTKLRLLELATIVSDGPSALTVIPFDPSTVQDIEKAILKSPLGLSPIVQGGRILIRIPSLSTEQREKLVKVVNAMVEEKKGIVRNLRDNARKTIKNAFEKKEITEDEKFRQEKEIDNVTQKYMEEISLLKEKKEEAILEI